jgi:hypothetical protein
MIKNQPSSIRSRGGRSGQAMLLAVLTLGATMLAVTTIAGLLMVYQIRQVTAFGSSAQAVFAADAGAEWSLYNYFQQSGQSETVLPAFINSATVSAACYDASGNPTSCTATTSVYAISKGSAGNTKRAFLATFSGASGTLP